MKYKQNLHRDQSGMVAITVTIILMIVISLIVIGFSTTTRREQRQALDSQLASQAFYAAESGINLAVDKLQTTPNLAKTTCGPSGPISQADYELDGTDVEITCLLINPNVTAIEYTSLDMNAKTSRISTINQIDKITIQWTSGSNGLSSCNGGTALPKISSWSCQHPLLRVDLVDLTNTPNALDATNLKNSQFTGFLYPNKTLGSRPKYNYSAGQAPTLGQILQAQCVNVSGPSTPVECSLDIDTSALSSKNFAIRVMSLYRTSSKVSVQAFNSGSATAMSLVGSQAVIDVTAKAQDVLKRVQARVNLSSSSNSYTPNFAIDSIAGVCKKYTTNGVTATAANGDPECSTP